MKKTSSMATVIIAIISIFVYCNQPSAPEKTPPTTISKDSLIKRGEYLVTIMGCDDCHSPKLFGPQGPYPDPEKRLSGHPSNMTVAKFDTGTARNWVLFNAFTSVAIGPWGTSFSANITSDSTGIGNWTEEQFFKVMREGKYKGLDNTRPILPPMPWPNYAKVTDEDLKALFAYLKTTRPVNNVVPEAIPPGR